MDSWVWTSPRPSRPQFHHLSSGRVGLHVLHAPLDSALPKEWGPPPVPPLLPCPPSLSPSPPHTLPLPQTRVLRYYLFQGQRYVWIETQQAFYQVR